MKKSYDQPKLIIQNILNSDVLNVSSDPFVNDIPWEDAL